MHNLQSRVSTMNSMTGGSWEPGVKGHLDHGVEKSEETSKDRGKFLVSALTPRDEV